MRLARLVLLALSLTLVPRHTSAQGTPFVLIAEVPPHSGSTVATEPLTVFHGRLLEPSAGMSMTSGRLTLVTSSDTASGSRTQPLGSHAEWQWRLTAPGRRVAFAVGSGVRHERAGSDVLIGRLTASTRLGTSRLVGNVTIEHALNQRRDTMDVVTGLGWTRAATGPLRVGVEALGEDLEGLWNAAEADGGARLFVGPTVHAGWPRLHALGRLTAGADVRGPGRVPGDSPLSTSTELKAGFALRTSVTLGF